MKSSVEPENVQFISEKNKQIVGTSRSPNGQHAFDQTTEKWDRVALIRQLLAAFGAVIGSVSFGMTTAFPATLTRNFAREDNTADVISIDESTESWIAASVALWMLMGVISGSLCMRIYGRRIAQVCLYICWICGWLIISYAYNVRCLFAGCALIGLGAGCHAVVSTVYVGEVTEPRFRGLISVQISLGVATGILAGHAQGVLFAANRTALRICAALPTIALGLVLAFARESPSWLAFNGRPRTAESVFLRLRNDAPSGQTELKSLLETAAAADSDRNRRRSSWYWCDILKREISSKAFRRSFLVINILFIVQQGSGLNAIVFHAITFLKAVSADDGSGDESSYRMDPLTSTIIIDTVRFFATLAACVLVKVSGRRKLYFWSACGALASLSALIICTLCRISGVVLIILTCAYIVFLYVGVSPIPWIMVGELYPANLKEFGICISSVCCFFTMLIVVKTALFLLAHFGAAITFTIYLLIMLIGVIFLYFRMPETNNISLQQIEKNLNTQTDDIE